MYAAEDLKHYLSSELKEIAEKVGVKIICESAATYTLFNIRAFKPKFF